MLFSSVTGVPLAKLWCQWSGTSPQRRGPEMQPGGHGDERYAQEHKLNIKLTFKIFQYQVNFIFFFIFFYLFLILL